MFSAHKITSTIKPNTFEDLNNGVWYYNYGITSEVVKQPNMSDPTKMDDVTIYSYIQVRIAGKPTYKECVKSIIREYIDVNEEFNLVNSYNKSQMTNTEVDSEYTEYLNLVAEIKANVKKDFGIKE